MKNRGFQFGILYVSQKVKISIREWHVSYVEKCVHMMDVENVLGIKYEQYAVILKLLYGVDCCT